MIVINLFNERCQIDFNLSDPHVLYSLHSAIRDELSYIQPDAEWSPKYKLGQWDGKISLYNKKLGTFPIGLYPKIKNLLQNLNVEFETVDKRPEIQRNYPFTCDFGPKILRDYQIKAGDEFYKQNGGILSLATGAGKTMTSCYIFSKLQVAPVIFVVPALELLKQTKKEFEKYLRLDGKPVKVGIAGDGICDLNLEGINVVTYQTVLGAYDKKYAESQYKIVDIAPSDGVRKSNAQIEEEYEKALKDLSIAKRSAKNQLKSLQVEIDSLQAKFEELTQLFQDNLDTKNQRIINKASKDLDLKLKQYSRKYDSLIKLQNNNFKKADSVYQNRMATSEDKNSIRDLVTACQAYIVDEAHIASVIIEEIGKYAVNATIRGGLSATPYRNDNQEIRIEGTLGQKIIEVSASDLVERGFLVPPKIFQCEIKEHHEAQTYQEAYELNIIKNTERNYRIKQFAETFKDNGTPTLILVERMEHGHILEDIIENAVFVPGGDKGELDPSDEEKNYRRRMLNKVENNEIILIATQWANVGVDAPKITALILAGSSSSPITTYQQIGRVLRCIGMNAQQSTENGKPNAIIIDFKVNHKNLKTHSNLRARVYRNERAWQYYSVKAE